MKLDIVADVRDSTQRQCPRPRQDDGAEGVMSRPLGPLAAAPMPARRHR